MEGGDSLFIHLTIGANSDKTTPIEIIFVAFDFPGDIMILEWDWSKVSEMIQWDGCKVGSSANRDQRHMSFDSLIDIIVFDQAGRGTSSLGFPYSLLGLLCLHGVLLGGNNSLLHGLFSG